MSRRQKVNIGLSPPQDTYFNEIKMSVGKDPHVHVEPLRQLPGGAYRVTLRVRGTRRARALATLMVLNKSFGNIRVQVRITDLEGRPIQPIRRSLTPAGIAALYRVAFQTNQLFQFVVVRLNLLTRTVFPVFKAEVVQFFNDDLSDLFCNFNNVAAFVFRDVMKNTISGTPILFSTVQQDGSLSRRSRR